MCFKYFIIHNTYVKSLCDGLFCHVTHLCNAHTMSGRLINAAHHNFPIALLIGSCDAFSISSLLVGTSSSLNSPDGAGVSFPSALSRLNSCMTLFMYFS